MTNTSKMKMFVSILAPVLSRSPRSSTESVIISSVFTCTPKMPTGKSVFRPRSTPKFKKNTKIKKTECTQSSVKQLKIGLKNQAFSSEVISTLEYTTDRYIGPHIFGRGIACAQEMNEQTQDDRSLFLDFVATNELWVSNTGFQTPMRKLLTFREASTPIGTPFTDTSAYAQLDFLLCNMPKYKFHPGH